jgi:oxygen-independent coproporphyrinogen-3 oxidase
MIRIGIDNKTFLYDVLDITKLFYNDEDISIASDDITGDYRGDFLSVNISDKNGMPVYELELRGNGFSGKSGTVGAGNSNVGNKHEQTKKFKRLLRHSLYQLLSRYTGRQLPWGMLTGIRPAKIVHELLDNGRDRDEILRVLNEYYGVSPDKCAILYEVARAERNILETSDHDMISLYIGIPYCPSRCVYCSFTSNPIGSCKDQPSRYIGALLDEIKAVNDMIRQKSLKVQNIYIGGGTPTSIDAASLDRLLSHIEKVFDLEYLQEYTLEAGRPDSITVEKLETVKGHRVNRISINPQSMNEETLRTIGRNHSPDDVFTAFDSARRLGFDNINMDVIAGLPGEDIPMFLHTLREIEGLQPESLTIHTIAVKKSSRLNEEKSRFKLAGAQTIAGMIDLGREYAGRMGMRPYYLYRQKNMLGNFENTGYCRPGREGIYNIQIMEERQSIIALGAGAVTKVVYPEENRIERAFNVKDVEEYIQNVTSMVERKRALIFP